MAVRSKKRKPAGDTVGANMVYFGIVGPRDRVPEVLWSERRWARQALAALAAPAGMRIARTFVTVQVVEAAPRRPPRAVS
jgi:hypothetical protein